MADEMGGLPLIRTRKQVPWLPEDLIPPLRLLNGLHAGLGRKLALISAQAGTGKTTLLAQWLADTECPERSVQLRWTSTTTT